ncbi:MAG TPA: DUF192 domain-containing protein [Candidatus Omnitrophota bacterium]|nr:DUF192 domain-containing protein [Candidatus Omnitrophota bacterium]
MKIVNSRNKNLLASDVILADSLLKRVKGLLGRKDFPLGSAMIIKPCNSVHTFFMQFPIDLVFMAKDNKVIKSVNSLPPNRLTSICLSAYYVIELPAGTLSKTSTLPTDLLEFTQ